MTKPLTKPQIVARMSDELNVDKKTAAAALDALSAVIHEQVAAGGAVTIPNVGKIYSRPRPARIVRNPATGDRFQKPADRQVKITVAKRLKNSANS